MVIHVFKKYLINFICFSIDASEESGRYGRLINHSKNEPNCEPILLNHGGSPRILFKASRDILAGEELYYDYNDRENILDNPWLNL